ncbi:hypothetical protein BKA62DRAFT_683235 [Auriculariales sp. MPI-PUGE-AT-0066]|nr:hypothetical protein BKA62DRAFT_683235 [Auriculariales sp. MPI-PUGE-AT-0066]
MASTSNTYLQSRFSGLIKYLLDHELVRSATFYAERFYHIDTTHHDARHLLASAYLKAGQTHSALHLVSQQNDNTCPGCHELIAKCCTTLGRYTKARDSYEMARIYATTTRAGPSLNTSSQSAVQFSEEAILHLKAGEASLKGLLKEQALDSFRRALKLNPLLWEAFEGLCTLGSFSDVNEIMPPRHRLHGGRADESSMFLTLNSLGSRGSLPTSSGAGFFTPDASQSNVLRAWRPEQGISQPFRINNNRDSISTADLSYTGLPDNSMHFVPGAGGMRAFSPSVGVPSAATTLPSQPSRYNEETGPAPKKARSSQNTENAGVNVKARTNGASATGDVFSSRANQAGTRSAIKPSREPERRSTRIRSNAAASPTKPAANVKHPPTPRDRRRGKTRAGSRSLGSEEDLLQSGVSPSASPRAQSPPRSEASPAPSGMGAFDAAAQEALEWQAADDYIYELMRIFAMASRSLAQYQCQDAIQHLDVLPAEQRSSPMVLVMLARAHYESADYPMAERFFQRLRHIQPYRVWDMDIYSTLLFYLQRNVQLSFLSQELLAIDSHAPQAWIAAGNCFSLQKERNQALTCFRRASQLDSRCAYAFTLSGHESMDEDIDKAIAFFQTALRADPRHYNAWYGLGKCYQSQSKQRQSEYHFRRASEIHPSNAVLLGCLGGAVQRRGALEEALALFDRAVKLCPDNAYCMYRRAKVLIGLRRYHEALKDLVRLRDLAPEESNVVFQLARLYRLTGDDVRAAQHLAMARDISPKSLGKIKKLMAVERDGDTGGVDMDDI